MYGVEKLSKISSAETDAFLFDEWIAKNVSIGIGWITNHNFPGEK